MVMDLTEPIPALVMTPTRLLRLAMLVAASGVAALLVAVGVLVWTYSGLQAGFAAADRTRRHVVEARCGRTGGSACTRARSRPGGGARRLPLPPQHPPPVPMRRSCGTRPWPPSPRPPRLGRPRPPCRPRVPVPGIPTVRLPGSSVPTVDWNAAGQSLGLQNLNVPALLWASGAGGGGGVPTGAIIGSATAIGTSVGNNAFDLLNTLILANSGFYGGRPTTSIPGVGLPGPGQVAAALAAVPSVGLPKLPAGLPTRGSECRNCRRCRRSVHRRSACPSCQGSASVSPAHPSGIGF